MQDFISLDLIKIATILTYLCKKQGEKPVKIQEEENYFKIKFKIPRLSFLIENQIQSYKDVMVEAQRYHQFWAANQLQYAYMDQYI